MGKERIVTGHAAVPALHEMGDDPYRHTTAFAQRDSRLLGERTTFWLKRGFKETVRMICAVLLMALMVIGLTVAGMCIILGLNYTLSIPLIAVLGAGALLSFATAMLRAANREAFINKVDSFLEVFGFTKGHEQQRSPSTVCSSASNSPSNSTAFHVPLNMPGMTIKHDSGLTANNAARNPLSPDGKPSFQPHG